MKLKTFLTIAGTAVLVMSGFATAALTQTSKAKASDEAIRSTNAGAVLGEIMATPDQEIPEALLRRAQGIAVIPHVVKGAFGIGGRYGKGLVAQRNADGTWGTPMFIDIGGGSFGLQLGIQATDIVMIFTNSEGIQPLMKGKLKIGADASATAGPVGRNAEAGTDIALKSAIYSYSRSKGLFAGVSLDGSVISMDDDANKAVYGGQAVSAETLTSALSASSMSTVQPFLRALEKWASSTAVSSK